MRKKNCLWLFLFISLCIPFHTAFATFTFSDTRFQNSMTTENLDAIIEEYELYDGWFWTTQANVLQDFHGKEDCPGWNTTVEEHHRTGYVKGWYGCRWPVDIVFRTSPSHGGYAECFAFAQFIGYLLSGDINPHHHWDFYYSTKASGGLKVGDIVRVEYTKNRKSVHHSAVVYAINGDEILFLQVSGRNYNQISVGKGFNDGCVTNATSLEEISAIPGLKVCRFTPNQ